jgi:hypothetical protein
MLTAEQIRNTFRECCRWLPAVWRQDPEVRFGVHARGDDRDRTPPLVRLKTLCRPGDQGEGCIIVILADED